jgi:hypothetical protein
VQYLRAAHRGSIPREPIAEDEGANEKGSGPLTRALSVCY